MKIGLSYRNARQDMRALHSFKAYQAQGGTDPSVARYIAELSPPPAVDEMPR